ncbi:MAG: O-antigen ligase family protein [Kiritimatiellae bacterium]|nr:O-antigen ligase family protein [Kiritimatiellia bacterium]
MMEFTCDGWVRQGFGFYNPNHAAALICALLPFLWAAWFRWRGWMARVPVALGTVLLLAALAATFSRTGLAVLGGELLFYLLLRKGAGWKMLIGVAVAAGAVAAGFGVHERFAVDASLINRFDIWKAGLALFGANPWSGVGLGNSGNLAGAFLLPDGIACRTLVNSHLTLLFELRSLVGLAAVVRRADTLSRSCRIAKERCGRNASVRRCPGNGAGCGRLRRGRRAPALCRRSRPESRRRFCRVARERPLPRAGFVR